MEDFPDRSVWSNVGKNDYAVGYDEVLGIDCLGSCVGIAGYDSECGEVYLFHGATLGNDKFDRMVEEFLTEEIRDLSSTQLFVGGTIDPEYVPMDSDDVIEARQAVEDTVDSTARIEWNKPPKYNCLAVSPNHGFLYETIE